MFTEVEKFDWRGCCPNAGWVWRNTCLVCTSFFVTGPLLYSILEIILVYVWCKWVLSLSCYTDMPNVKPSMCDIYTTWCFMDTCMILSLFLQFKAWSHTWCIYVLKFLHRFLTYQRFTLTCSSIFFMYILDIYVCISF